MNIVYLYSVLIRVFAVLLFTTAITSERSLFIGQINLVLSTVDLKAIAEIFYLISTLLTAGILWIYYRSIADWIVDTTSPTSTGIRMTAFLLVATGIGNFVISIYFLAKTDPVFVNFRIDPNALNRDEIASQLTYIIYILVCTLIVFGSPWIDTQTNTLKRVAELRNNQPED